MINKCQFCGEDTSNTRSYLPMSFPVPEMEKLIDKWGREDWWKNLEKDQNEFTQEEGDELNNLSFYDQLLNTVGRGYSCTKCEVEGYERLAEYYPKEG